MGPARAARLLAVASLPRVRLADVFARYQETGSAEAVYASFAAESEERAAKLASLLRGATASVDAALRSGLAVFCLQDAGYPPVLLTADLPPPPVLFVRGRLPPQLLAPTLGELDAVGVVGTRKGTSEGLAAARELGAALAAAGVVVVSGLALGIDGEAHRGALDAHRAGAEAAAPTVAVLGGAHDRLHPKAHAALADEVVAAGGAVVSEHPPGVRPQPYTFLHRNRLIAALSRAVVVVEAGARSGALNTAEHASRLGRDVLTLPAWPTDRRRAGNLGLLRDGARPLIDLTDVAACLSSPKVRAELAAMSDRGAASAGRGRDPQGRLFTPPPKPSTAGGTRGSGRSSGSHGADVLGAYEHTGAAPRLDMASLRLLAVLARHGDASFDGLLARLTRSGRKRRPTAAELAGCLVRLELTGCVTRGEDGRFRCGAAAGLGGRRRA